MSYIVILMSSQPSLLKIMRERFKTRKQDLWIGENFGV